MKCLSLPAPTLLNELLGRLQVTYYAPAGIKAVLISYILILYFIYL